VLATALAAGRSDGAETVLAKARALGAESRLAAR
jgi:hypothetical protein